MKFLELPFFGRFLVDTGKSASVELGKKKRAPTSLVVDHSGRTRGNQKSFSAIRTFYFNGGFVNSPFFVSFCGFSIILFFCPVAAQCVLQFTRIFMKSRQASGLVFLFRYYLPLDWISGKSFGFVNYILP